MSMRTDDSPRSRSRSPQLPSRREDQARYSVEVPLLSEPTVPKHSSQGSVNTDETVKSSNTDKTVKIHEASERQGEVSERRRDLWVSILEQQVLCHATKLDSLEAALNAILRARANDGEYMRTIERRTQEQRKTIDRRIQAIQGEMQSLQCEYETHAEQFRLRIVDIWKRIVSSANRLDELQNSLQLQRIASAVRPD